MTPASCLEGEEGVPRKRGFLKTVNILTIKKGGKSQTKNSNILQKKNRNVLTCKTSKVGAEGVWEMSFVSSKLLPSCLACQSERLAQDYNRLATNANIFE